MSNVIASVSDYLQAPRCAVVSTLSASGEPHQAVLHYWLADGALFLNGAPQRVWARNLARDGRVSVVVHDRDDDLHWVGIKGEASLVADGEPAVRDAMELARRYGEDPQEYANQERVTFRVTPRRVFEYG